MKTLRVLTIGGLAAFLVTYWLMPDHALGLQGDRMPSPMPNSMPGGETRLPAGGQAGTGAGDARSREVQALVDRILARPLFNSDRRPAPESRAAGPPNLPRLTAVLVSGRGKTVIFAGGADEKPVALTEGGRIGNYVVQSIGVGQVTMSGPNGMQLIRPTPDNVAQAPPPPVTIRPSIADLLRQSAPSDGVLVLSPSAQR